MKVTIITLAWNYKNYISKCIESVLNQTFTDIEYFILDSGSTDGTKEIIEKYAAQDNRIRVRRREENIGHDDSMWIDFPVKNGTGKYFMNLDCDDWIDPDCIERLVRIAEAGNFDITATGSYLHNEFTSTVTERRLTEKMCVDRKDFAKYYPFYHFFFRTTWAKLIKTDIIRSTPDDKIKRLSYGGDTMYMFAWLRKAKNLCVDNSAMYHYIMHKSSASTTFNNDKVYCNTELYNDAVDFLSEFGPISSQNREFLYRVYANGISDVSSPLFKSDLNTVDKLHAYYEILLAPVTKDAFKLSDSDDVKRSRSKLLKETIYFTAQLHAPLKEYEEVFSHHLPICGRMITYKTAGLILKEKALTDAVLADNGALAAEMLIKLAASGKYAKQYDIMGMLGALSQNNPLICSINDADFLSKYGSIYMSVWNGKYDEALDTMTDILLNGKCSNETFFQLYLSIAAVLECVDEFVFGKIKLAEFYCSKRRFGECRVVLDDLADMGVDDNEDIARIKENPEYVRFVGGSPV